VIPGRGRRPDLVEALRQDGECPGRDVPVLGSGHHVFDRQHLACSQTNGRRAWTGRVIVKRTRVLESSPGMEPTRGQSQEPQKWGERHKRTGALHGSHDPHFGASVGQTLVRQCESRTAKQGEGQPKECRELLHASPELENFSLEFRCRPVRHVHSDDDRWRLAEPATRRRARNLDIRGDGHVAGVADEIAKAMVVAALRAPRRCHENDHRRFVHAAQSLKNIAGRFANVRLPRMTTTRAGTCRMCVRTAPLTIAGPPVQLQRPHNPCREAMQERVVRQIRMLRAMRRELETG